MKWDEDQRTFEHYREELILTLLRTQNGIPLRWLDAVFSRECRTRFWQSTKVEKALSHGFLIKSETHLSLSAQEKIRGDSWAVTVMSELHD